MKKSHYILFALFALLLSACTPDEPRDGNVEWAVRAVWQNGLGNTPAQAPTRALTYTDILSAGNGPIAIDYRDYPATIDIICKKGDTEIQALTLTKGSGPCGAHYGYWNYTPSFLFRDQLIRREDYKFYAKAVIDEDGDPATTTDGDRLEGIATQSNIHDNHLLLTLHHTKALLRFAFKVDSRYDKVRYIRVTDIQINNSPCTLVDKVLTTSDQYIAYIYIDPTEVTVSTENTIICTYNIYDKDSATDPDLTRKDVVAQNTFTLGSLKDASHNAVSEIEAGYYYDLHVTLNPDYLYVLAEHDNKHITIN